MVVGVAATEPAPVAVPSVVRRAVRAASCGWIAAGHTAGEAYTLAYAAICGFWVEYWPLELRLLGEAPHAAQALGAGWFAQRSADILAHVRSSNLGAMATSLVRLITLAEPTHRAAGAGPGRWLRGAPGPSARASGRRRTHPAGHADHRAGVSERRAGATAICTAYWARSACSPPGPGRGLAAAAARERGPRRGQRRPSSPPWRHRCCCSCTAALGRYLGLHPALCCRQRGDPARAGTPVVIVDDEGPWFRHGHDVMQQRPLLLTHDSPKIMVAGGARRTRACVRFAPRGRSAASTAAPSRGAEVCATFAAPPDPWVPPLRATLASLHCGRDLDARPPGREWRGGQPRAAGVREALGSAQARIANGQKPTVVNLADGTSRPACGASSRSPRCRRPP